MSDGFLVLARADAGLTCFLLPRVLDDGARNDIRLQRLKDKLGNRSNASSEIELDAAWAVRLGDEGRGVRTIIDMVASTRLDCVLGSTATMRAALTRAVHHTRHRSAFGARLVDQPLMRNVLTDLALESEAATVLALRLAHAVDAGEQDLVRLGVALGKFWVCKRTAPMVAEALECLGGNGYVEENGLARLYREAPLNSIWEGSGNVGALDVLRALAREPASLAALGEGAGPGPGARPRARRGHRRLRGRRGRGPRRRRAVGCPPHRRAPRRHLPGRAPRPPLPRAGGRRVRRQPGARRPRGRLRHPRRVRRRLGRRRRARPGPARLSRARSPGRRRGGSAGQGVWSSRVRSASTSKSAAGHWGSIVSRASRSRFVTARRAYHFRSAGTTCQGATAVEQRSRATW